MVQFFNHSPTTRYLKQANVPLNEFEFSWSKVETCSQVQIYMRKKLIQVSNIQPQLEKLITKNYFLNISAKEAYKVDYIQGSTFSHHLSIC